MTELKTIVNNSAKTKAVVYGGKQIVLQPHEEREVVKELADVFIAHHGPVVAEVSEIGGVFDDGAFNPEEFVWIANMTGNPDDPETVQTKKWLNKEWTLSSAPNPRKEPRTLKREAQGAMKEYTAKDGAPEALNLFATTYSIPPYKRRMFPKQLGSWWLTREGNAMNAMRNMSGKQLPSSIKSRPPTVFQPDMRWSLNDMRLFLQLSDPDAELGPSFEELKGGDYEHNEAKKLCLQRIFFRDADPSYRMVTEYEFKEVKRAMEEEAAEQERLEKFTEEELMILKEAEKLKKTPGKKSKEGYEILKQATQIMAEKE